MKSRLKKVANHTEPTINQIIEDSVVNPNKTIQEDRSEEFLLAKQLFAATPFISANNLIYEFANRIKDGVYSDLGPVVNAKNNWNEWLLALNDFLNEDGILDEEFPNSLEKFIDTVKIAGPNNLYTDKYTDNLYTDDYLDMNKDLNKGQLKPVSTEKENYISDSFAVAKDLIYSLPIVPRYDLMAQLAQDIERGDFDDLGTVNDYESNKERWLARARKILQARNIILS